MTKSKKIMTYFLIIAFGIWVLWMFKWAEHYPSEIDLQAKDDFWGVTYSDKFSEELGLDWQEVYLATLDDLEVRNIRLPIYWDQIEKNRGEFDFSRYDYILDEGAKRGVKFIVNVGWRLPRWPECHFPDWLETDDPKNFAQETTTMLEQVINHFKHRQEIVAWQVENEPLLATFGQCPKTDKDLLKKEIAQVKELDGRPVIISASGELSTWRNEIKLGDIFATTMYRVVWNPTFKYVHYPIPAWFYKLKLYLNGVKKEDAIISELQTEPWVPNGTLADEDFLDKDRSMSVEQFRANLQYAINVDFRQAYLWGVEWWYLQKQRGNPEYWDIAKDLFEK